MRQSQKMLVQFVFLFCCLMQATAQQLRTQIGEERAAAVDAMLNSAFPGTTPIWDVTLSVQAPDGTNTRLALTNVVKFPGTSQPKYVAGVQEFNESARSLAQLRKGEDVTGVRQKLVAVMRSGTGSFQVVSSIVFEPNHALTIIDRLSSDPLGSPRVLVSYKTIDLYQSQFVEIGWYALLDTNLNVVRKLPSGVEFKSIGSDAQSKVLYITPSATGVVATNYQTGTKTDIPCSAICEPTVQQLAAIN